MIERLPYVICDNECGDREELEDEGCLGKQAQKEGYLVYGNLHFCSEYCAKYYFKDPKNKHDMIEYFGDIEVTNLDIVIGRKS